MLSCSQGPASHLCYNYKLQNLPIIEFFPKLVVLIIMKPILKEYYFYYVFGVSRGAQTDPFEEVMISGVSRRLLRGLLGDEKKVLIFRYGGSQLMF